MDAAYKKLGDYDFYFVLVSLKNYAIDLLTDPQDVFTDNEYVKNWKKLTAQLSSAEGENGRAVYSTQAGLIDSSDVTSESAFYLDFFYPLIGDIPKYRLAEDKVVINKEEMERMKTMRQEIKSQMVNKLLYARNGLPNGKYAENIPIVQQGYDDDDEDMEEYEDEEEEKDEDRKMLQVAKSRMRKRVLPSQKKLKSSIGGSFKPNTQSFISLEEKNQQKQKQRLQMKKKSNVDQGVNMVPS